MPTTYYVISDAQADPCWAKTISPYTNTQIANDAKEYTNIADANIDCAILNNTNRFHVVPSPKAH